ncbi:MAG: tRNA (N6-isopentenyl adenosine(37)-C2)-methylthiotransferase MiaB [Deltaproteobacteria bacterium]|nr:tRNA (N6-isopentenyl adenosine(37)-C2)-methylthiotransferase MiaB [Deltaproteobacteria bacterium]
MPGPKKKLYIRTFGCQMNVADSERMAQVLADDFVLTDKAEEADIYLINTCAIRRKSEEKVRSLLGSLKGLKQRRPQLILGVGGCVAQQEGDRLLGAAPHLDLVFGAHGIYRLPQLVSRAAAGERPVDVELSRCFPEAPRRRWESPPARTFVTIMQGCNNFCSFCVVPYVRGREYSREPSDIIGEIGEFLAAGGQEVTLLGQNVNSYGRGLMEPVTFPELLRRVAALPGLRRLRFATSHPRDLSPDLIAAYGELPALCEHLHLPVQSGSNRILQAMNRGYTREEYLDKAARLRQTRPDLALSTDLIVGFPGETEADFEQTLDLMRQAGFDQAFSFKYSPRPQTQAAAFSGQVPDEIKAERLSRLQTFQDDLTLKAHRRLVGKVREALVEGGSKRSPVELCGRLRTNQVVNFQGPQDLVGRLLMVEITEAHPHSLKGRRAVGPPLS